MTRTECVTWTLRSAVPYSLGAWTTLRGFEPYQLVTAEIARNVRSSDEIPVLLGRFGGVCAIPVGDHRDREEREW